MRTNEEMQNSIMRRVWAVYFFRRLFSPAVRVGVVLASAIILVGQVSVPDVMANAYNVADIMGLMTFAFSAFLDTSVMVQTAVVAAGLVTALSFTDLVRTLADSERALA